MAGALSRLIIRVTCDTIQPGFEEGITCGVLPSSVSETHGTGGEGQ